MSQPHPDELDHGTPFHALRVREVIEETHDAKSFVLDVPSSLSEAFRCRAGQFLTFRIPWDGFRIARCYSLSSSPEIGEPPKVTVKRVADGRMSNWMNDRLAAGDRMIDRSLGLNLQGARGDRIVEAGAEERDGLDDAGKGIATRPLGRWRQQDAIGTEGDGAAVA